MITHTIIKDTRLYKTVEYPCESINSYMKLKSNQPCRTNKMLWLSEDKDRALSYGKNLKIFTIQSDIDLWNLIDSDYYPFKITDDVDEEFVGKMQSILRLFGNKQSLESQCIKLYELLTGHNNTAKRQLEILKTLLDDLDEYPEFTFDNKL